MTSRYLAKFDWYVREGAYEALLKVRGKEARAEVLRVLKGKGYEYSKEAIVHSLIWKIRRQFEKDHGENDDRKIQEAKYLLRKRRGVAYFRLVLPSLAYCLLRQKPGRRLLLWPGPSPSSQLPTQTTNTEQQPTPQRYN